MLKSFQSIQIFLYIFYTFNQIGAQIKSGPMLAYVEYRTAKIWCEAEGGANLILKYWPTNLPSQVKEAYVTTHKAFSFETFEFDLVDLIAGTEYNYQVFNKKTKIHGANGSFTTQEIWKWRKSAPDFKFLAGSCNYVNDVEFDRPGKPYGSDSIIFTTMAKEKPTFMLWLGDSWYTREPDFQSKWGLWYRASHDRATPVVQQFLKSTSHIGIWDDHDYGPNNEGISYHLKEEAREVFKAYFPNPSFGFHGKGTYTKVTYYDVDLFLMDNRTWRTSDNMNPYIGDKPNPEKKMFGPEQMSWLKNSLLNSTNTFKIIVNGSQSLNKTSTGDCWANYPVELEELLEFIELYKINGVLFLSGDKHISEIIKLERLNSYPLYDITTSSLTAGISKVWGKEINNPLRVNNILLEEHNYGRFSISGPSKEREIKIEFVDINGKSRREFVINERDISYNKK